MFDLLENSLSFNNIIFFVLKIHIHCGNFWRRNFFFFSWSLSPSLGRRWPPAETDDTESLNVCGQQHRSKKKLGDDLVTNLCATKIGLKPLSYQGVWYSVFQGGTIYYSVVKCSSYWQCVLQCGTVECKVATYIVVCYSVVQYSSLYCSVIQCSDCGKV